MKDLLLIFKYFSVVSIMAAFLIGCQTANKVTVSPENEIILENGLKVLFVEDKQLPYFSLNLMVKTGSASDPSELMGLSSFVAELLDKGTTKKSAVELADALGQIGAQYSATASADYTYIQLETLAQHQAKLMDLLSEMLVHQRFPSSEIRRLKSQKRAALKQASDDPSTYANLLFDKYLYNGTSYSSNSIGNYKSLRKISKKDITKHFFKYFTPNNSILSIVGRFDENVKSQVKQYFGIWRKRSLEVPAIKANMEKLEKNQALLVHRKDVVQAQIRFGHEGITRTNPDFLKLRVANAILGKGFASRLVNHIRDNLGLTYHISSRFDSMKELGGFSIKTFTKVSQVNTAVRETLKLLREFKDKGVTSDEVESVKSFLLGIFPQSIETPEKLALNLMALRLYGISDDYLKNYVSNINKISTSDVNRVIKKYFKPDNMKILIYANSPNVKKQLNFIEDIEVKSYLSAY